MRILHTSDLHIGKNLYGRSMEAAHEALLTWLVAQVEAFAADVLIVAGDIFDVSAPPSFARRQYYDFCAGMVATGAQLVVLGGNHDSPSMLRETHGLLSSLPVLVIPESTQAPDQQIHVLARRDGRPGAILCGVPFLHQRNVVRSWAGQSIEERRIGVMQGIAEHYAAIYAAALLRRDELDASLPIIATGHLTTVGATSSESVQEIYVGNLNCFPANQLPPADYIALGHIHRPQNVGGIDHVRYCGSPLALSFDELDQRKQVLLVEFSGTGRTIEPIEVPVFQPMLRVVGTLAELPDRLRMHALAFNHSLPAWAEVTVSDSDYLPDLVRQVEDMAAGLPLDVVRVRRATSSVEQTSIAPAPVTLVEVTPHDVFERLLTQKSDAIPPERIDRLRELFSESVARIHADTAE
ncbi:exonuclease subunit SbcD [Lysobacter xanthus]